MGKKQYLLTVVLAVVAGFVGGVGSSWVLTGLPVFAQKTAEPAKVIQAERFEVVDKDGKTRAWFGTSYGTNSPRLEMEEAYTSKNRHTLTLDPFMLRINNDNGEREAVIQLGLALLSNGRPSLILTENEGSASLGLLNGRPFLTLWDKDGKSNANLDLSGIMIHDQNGKLRAGLTLSDGEPRLDLFDKNEKTRTALGLVNGAPSLVLGDKDEKPRVWLHLGDDGEPTLSLYDKNPKSRVTLAPLGLGILGQDGKPRAWLSLLNGEPDLSLFDKDEKPRAALSLSQGEPRLELSDKNGKTRATLGYTELEHTRTGSEEKRATSSLVLFNKDGKVIWEAP